MGGVSRRTITGTGLEPLVQQGNSRHEGVPRHVLDWFWLVGESELFGLQRCVPEGRDEDELVAVPLAGLGELEVECLVGRGNYLTILSNLESTQPTL
jgi:hypothetical protein